MSAARVQVHLGFIFSLQPCFSAPLRYRSCGAPPEGRYNGRGPGLRQGCRGSSAGDPALWRPALSQQTDANLPPSKILVVDDNPQNLELLVAYLEDLPNVTVVPASNGIEAMIKVGRDQPDLILLDVMMPKMSGFEVCRQIKSDPATRDVPIIMVTALNEMGDHERARDCGTDEFLTKPVDRTELLARVRSLLGVRHLKRQMEGD